jgi:GntR family transcriptional regulator, carbon starvation induced regulator
MSEARRPVTAAGRHVDASHLTLATRAYAALRTGIVSGDYLPGCKLHIQSLCREFEVGLSPMREALTRLSREGLVLHEEQRGFRVRPLDEARLEELTKTRCWLNTIGLRESIVRGDDRWEEGVLLTYHRMSKLSPFVPEDGRLVINRAWDQEHRSFHTNLIAACGSHWLIEYCEQLADAADCYRHAAPRSPGRVQARTAEHELILKATLARDADAAVACLIDHFHRSTDHIRDRLREEQVSERAKAGGGSRA